ncbi:MAG: transporter [Burkholderiales bacterium]
MPRAAAGKTMQLIVVTVIALLAATPGKAQTAGAAALAAAVANPVAALISVPIQFNYDQHIGPDRAGDRWTINVQPVIPFTLNEDWNLISRTIAPIVVQDDIFPGSGSQTGLGDIAQSLFFSPRKPTAGGWVWGAGPVFLLPTATDDLLGTKKWGAGPTGVVLRQDHGWSYGALANHIWSFAGDESRQNVNQSFLQPFLSYTTPEAWTFGVNSESTYNWNGNRWTVPIGVSVSHVMKFGEQPVSLSAGLRYWVESPDYGPQGWGLRFGVAFLFPK